MKKLLLITLAMGITSQAQAYTYNYICKDHGKAYPLKVDDAANTLTWRGTVYKIKETDCAKAGWHAEKDGVGFDFCTATKGYADFQLNGASIVCDMKR
ncbi:hypothetical protein QA639_21860 [Bradyrhizobium pachyrhizi]|uniref:hypothetical protein n=1 Tax=Bradyrhizobium pachyrhizi TaxID=280333 RepID=UPI0024B13D9E|nr:hypothetical protein [Bradyrhizobium pachyrhizi]WFU52356.1 hypothetical protein QA639_21860 [Bradyrhizobium pachyrhizi]